MTPPHRSHVQQQVEEGAARALGNQHLSCTSGSGLPCAVHTSDGDAWGGWGGAVGAEREHVELAAAGAMTALSETAALRRGQLRTGHAVAREEVLGRQLSDLRKARRDESRAAEQRLVESRSARDGRAAGRATALTYFRRLAAWRARPYRPALPAAGGDAAERGARSDLAQRRELLVQHQESLLAEHSTQADRVVALTTRLRAMEPPCDEQHDAAVGDAPATRDEARGGAAWGGDAWHIARGKLETTVGDQQEQLRSAECGIASLREQLLRAAADSSAAALATCMSTK
eukprot:gene11805-161_t